MSNDDSGGGKRDVYLFLNQSKLLQITFEEGHLLLLSLTVAVADDVVVLLFDLIQLNFELNNLKTSSVIDPNSMEKR